MASHPDGYWTTNLYRHPQLRPEPEAPCRDLRPAEARRFARLRSALLELAGVEERVRYLGGAWKWTWEYRTDRGCLVYLHPMRGSVSATLALAPELEVELLSNGHVGPRMRRAIEEGTQAATQRWCWLEISEEALAEELLTTLRHQHHLMAADPT